MKLPHLHRLSISLGGMRSLATTRVSVNAKLRAFIRYFPSFVSIMLKIIGLGLSPDAIGETLTSK